MSKVCPNCGNLANTSHTRLVRDSCGHTKCRLCILYEEHGCKSCESNNHFEKIGNFDYPLRKSSEVNRSENAESELLVSKNNGAKAIGLDQSSFISSNESSREASNFYENNKSFSKSVEGGVHRAPELVAEEEKSDNDNNPIEAGNSKKNKDESRETERASKVKWKAIDRSHISILPGSPGKYQCNICGKIIHNKKGTCYHDACVTGIRRFTCLQCGRGFIQRSHFEYHERTHTGYKPFKCTLCDKAFPQKNKLNRHMLTHSKIKRFSCTKCDKSYYKKDDLKIHLTVHSGSTPFSCKSCGKAFRVLHNLKRHILTHSSERPYVCDHCNKGFKDKSLLIRHKRIHEKERPFSCAHCTRLFISKSELRRHISTHSSEKPFSCEFCKTDFRRKDNLNRHIRHHHSESSTDNLSTKSSNEENKSPRNKKLTLKQKSKKKISKTSSSLSKISSKSSPVLSNSQNQINSRLDSMGNITPVIRVTGELSNAVPVINGPISIKKFTESTESRKKTFSYIEPIPLAEAVVINKRIEEKLYPQNTSHNYYYPNYSIRNASNRASAFNNYGSFKNNGDKITQPEKNCLKLRLKGINMNLESSTWNSSISLDKGGDVNCLDQRVNSAQILNGSTIEVKEISSRNDDSCNGEIFNSKTIDEKLNYISIIKKTQCTLRGEE